MDSDYDLFAQVCLPTNGIFEALVSRLFVLVTNTTKKQQRFEKRKVLGHYNDDISTIVCTKEPQKASCYDQLVPSVVGTINAEEDSSSQASHKEGRSGWRK